MLPSGWGAVSGDVSSGGSWTYAQYIYNLEMRVILHKPHGNVCNIT